MTLNRWIAAIFLIICLVYGYTAYFTMDAQLPPFMKQSPMWPSSFPKVLAALGVLFSFIILLTPAARDHKPGADDINYRRLGDYHLGQAVGLLGLMVLYALCLRPIGFLISTVGFLVISGFLLGERKFHIMIPIALVTAVPIWYLVQQVLGIYLRPLPWFFGQGG